MEQLPVLLILGPTAIRKYKDLLRFLLLMRAYSECDCNSLRKAHILSLQHAKVWGADKTLVSNWENFRRSATEVETLFTNFYQSPDVRLFRRLGEGLPFIEISESDAVIEFQSMVEEFIKWYEKPVPNPWF